MQLGYTMMTEQAGPADLVGHVVAAEQAGFDFAVSSDHYFPWLDEMGRSPNAWVTLGAVAQATSRIDLMSYATCPTARATRTSAASTSTSSRRSCGTSPRSGCRSPWRCPARSPAGCSGST